MKRPGSGNDMGRESQKICYASRVMRHGFTLIELMVAASILGLIGLAILTTFGSGFHVYERVQSYGGVQTDVLLALEEMEKNLHNTFFSSAVAFDGKAQSIRFPLVAERIRTIEGVEVSVPSVEQMSYYLDEDNGQKVLTGKRSSYSQATSTSATENGRGNILALVNSLVFSYYLFDGEEGVYVWKESWSSEEKGFPAGVKVELTFLDGNLKVPLVRTILIPTSRVESDLPDAEEEGA